MTPELASARALATSVGAMEGPLARADGSVLAASIDRGHIYEIRDGRVLLFAVTGSGPNGLAEAADGTIYVAMSGRVPRRPRDGTHAGILAIDRKGQMRWLTTEPVSPNDLCFGPDGRLYVSDPTWGRVDDGRIWSLDVISGEPRLELSVAWYPNGIAFGLDDRLYVADTPGRRIVAFEVTADGLEGPTVIADVDGPPDGIAFDARGNIIVALLDADHIGDVRTYSVDGRCLHIYDPRLSNNYSNVALAGDGRLIITAIGDPTRIGSGDDSGGAVMCADGWPQQALPLYPHRRRTDG